MKNTQPKHAAFPSTQKTRITDALDFTTIAPHIGASDLFTVLMANAETAFQQIHNWEFGKDYDQKDIIQAACAMFPCFVNENHTYTIGYQYGDVNDDDFVAWKNALKKQQQG